jgi:hypothetical protein
MSFYGELQITCDAQLSQFLQLVMFDLRPVFATDHTWTLTCIAERTGRTAIQKNIMESSMIAQSVIRAA